MAYFFNRPEFPERDRPKFPERASGFAYNNRMSAQWPESQLLSRIREVLLRRRIENAEIGIEKRDNIFDGKLMCVLAEELCRARFGGRRANSVNEDDWDVVDAQGRKIQVKIRAIYGHNTDLIHIDFKALRFDALYLVIVDEQLNLLGEGLLPAQSLALLVRQEKSGKLRLRDVRRRCAEYFATVRVPAA